MAGQDYQDGPYAAWKKLVRAETIRDDEAQKIALAKLQKLHEELGDWKPQGPFPIYFAFKFLAKKPVPPKGVYLWGDVGRGKSMIMDIFHQASNVPLKRRVHFHQFMQEVHEKLHEVRSSGKSKGDDIAPVAEDIAAKVSLLCLDELQVTDVADAMLVGRLFGALLEKGVVVVSTSNRPPDDLYKNGINRQLFVPFIELIKEKMEVHKLEGAEDYRLTHLKMHDTFRTPTGGESSAKLEEIFKELTVGAKPEALDLHVKGRKLHIPVSAEGVALMTFPSLCAEALGAADYIELARSFHTLILDGIPELGPENRNEAKRFVTLVDELYEHKTKLIAAADAKPEALYPEGDGAFEFERTVSRLIEMQSDDYLHAEHLTGE